MSQPARGTRFSWLVIFTLLIGSCSQLSPREKQVSIGQMGTRTPSATAQFIPPTQPVETQVISFKPSPTPTVTHTPTLTPLPLQSLDGNMDEEVSLLEKNAPRQGSEGFIVPDDQAMADFHTAVLELVAGRPQAAAGAIEKYGYEIYLFRDQGEANHTTYLLREGLPIQRGWGLYAIRPEACGTGKPSVSLEAPHILADERTPQIALVAFRALQGCALLISGAHRDANQDGAADAAHEAQTIFQAVHATLEGVGGKASLFFQFHGFSARKHPGYPAAVLGGSPVGLNALNDLLDKITQSLEKQGISTGICAESQWEALCGESNIQSKMLQSGMFIHLELDDIIRSAPGPVITSLVEALAVR